MKPEVSRILSAPSARWSWLAATGRNVNVSNIVHGGVRAVAFHPEFATNGRFLDAVTTLDPLDPTRDDAGELSQATIQELSILFDHDNNSLTPGLAMSFENILRSDPNWKQVRGHSASRSVPA